MAKNKISEYSSIATNNVDIAGINIAEGCAPSGINNAIRELMAQLKDQQTGADGDSFTVGGAFTCSGAAVFSSTVAISGAATFSGTVALGSTATASTQTAGDSSTKVATTAFVSTAVGTALQDSGANGILVRTAASTTTARTLTGSAGLTVANGTGVSGNPTITLEYATATNIGGLRASVSGTTLNLYTTA